MRWPAPTERPWTLHGKRKRHFSEFSSGAARGDGGECRQQRQHQHTESRHDQEGRRAKPAHRESGNAGNGLLQALSVFFFSWGRDVETRCSCCRPPTLCSDKVSRNQRQRSGNRLRRTKEAHRGKPATADNRPPAKLTGAKDQRKPCGAPFATVVETGGAGRGTGIATPEPTSNSGRRCAGQFGGRRKHTEGSLQRRTTDRRCRLPSVCF